MASRKNLLLFSFSLLSHAVLEGAAEEEAEEPDATVHATLSEETSNQEKSHSQSGNNNEGNWFDLLCVTVIRALIDACRIVSYPSLYPLFVWRVFDEHWCIDFFPHP